MCSFDNNNLVSEYEPSACKLQYCIVRHFQILLTIKNGSSWYNIQSCAWSELSLELTLLSGICHTQEPMHNNSMHSKPCTRSIPYKRSHACKRSHARDPIQEIPCTRSHAQGPIQEIPYKRSHAQGPIQEIPCKRSHAWDPMQEIPCTRSHAEISCTRSHARDLMHEIPCMRANVWDPMNESSCISLGRGAWVRGYPCMRAHTSELEA